ncbi:MAG: extracellular solute-binding protein [Candidatus Magasanikbacteria bacterium]|nr:extracellular solute-binding protein [Candidatus Magasanikbacteria bacterium]
MAQRKNIFVFVTMILVVFLVFTGFGCKGLSAEQQQATKAVSLEYWTVNDDVDAINELIAKYKAERPYLSVVVKQLRSDELYDRLLEALSEDKGPDIVSVHVRELRKFQSKLATMPPSISDTTMLNQKNLIGQVETIVTTRPVAMPTAFGIDREYLQTVKKDVIIDNKIYGLPLSLDTMAIYYNKDLLDRSQVAEPPTTWEEFQAAVRKISKYSADTGKIIQSGVAMGSAGNVVGIDDILYTLFKQSNVEVISRDNRAIFNVAPSNLGGAESPAASVMTFYTDFANPTRDTYSWNESMDDSLESFIQGKVAFFIGYSYHNSQIKARAPQLNYGVLPMLQLDPEKPANAANYWIQTVVGKSKHPSEAWGLINYMTHSQATEGYLNKTKRPTALRNLVNKQKEDIDLSPFVSQLLIAENWYRGTNYQGAVQALKDMVTEWMSVPPNYSGREEQWGQEVLNRAAAKVSQTLR